MKKEYELVQPRKGKEKATIKTSKRPDLTKIKIIETSSSRMEHHLPTVKNDFTST